MPSQSRRWAMVLAAVVLSLIGDAIVLRHALTGRQIALGEVRRGYFEKIRGSTGLATDEVIRPVFPSCVLTADGILEVPPGMAIVAPLRAGERYTLDSASNLAPYIVVGSEVPLPVSDGETASPTEGAIERGLTLTLTADGHLATTWWDPDRPWRNDETRLRQLRDACAGTTVSAVVDGRYVRLTLGECEVGVTLDQATSGRPSLAILAGPDWVRLRREHGWTSERWFVWPVAAAIAVKSLALAYAFGLGACLAVSLALLLGSFALPVPAVLTYPLPLAVGLVVAVIRLVGSGLRRIPRPARAPVLIAGIAILGAAGWTIASQPRSFPPIIHFGRGRHADDADRCALVGYSTVEDASLRRSIGGARYALTEACEPCRNSTGSLSAGGEVLSWARDAFCATPPRYAGDGHVVFLGGANDDFFWGVTTLARLFVVSEQGSGPWKHNQLPAIEGSFAKLNDQTAALAELMGCVQSRNATFYLLHDFLVTDIDSGRDPTRQAMLETRRRAVEAAGGRFVDLATLYASEVGISWFNDYVHPSAIQHARIAAEACRLIEAPARAPGE